MINQSLQYSPSNVFYPVGAGGFNGSTYLTRAVSDFNVQTTGTFSCWIGLTGGNATNMVLFSMGLGFSFFTISRTASNKIRVNMSKNVGGLGPPDIRIFTYETVNSYTSSSPWFHFMTSFDSSLSAGNKIANLYINNISDLTIVADVTGALSANNTLDSYVGNDAGASLLNAGLSELYFDSANFLDLSTLANRRKFYSATNRPVPLGSNGSFPTGSQPRLYLKGTGTGFNVNSGSIGNYITTGTLTTPATTPSQP